MYLKLDAEVLKIITEKHNSRYFLQVLFLVYGSAKMMFDTSFSHKSELDQYITSHKIVLGEQIKVNTEIQKDGILKLANLD